MKRRIGLASSFVVAAILVAHPVLASADVVPARKAKAAKDSAKVEQRLVSLGVPAKEASDCVGSLTAAELGFFAEDTARVQSVAGITWYEFLAGCAVGGAVALAVFLLADHSIQ
jgi:hypothetical protein